MGSQESEAEPNDNENERLDPQEAFAFRTTY